MKRGTIFVAIQFICILILLKITVRSLVSWGLLVQILAIILGLWSISEARKSKISIFPELKEGAKLIQTGPYSIIRHPMYSSILLFFFPVLIQQANLTNSLVYLILLVNLIVKLRYEEQILLGEFEKYASYKEKTFRLIPYIY